MNLGTLLRPLRSGDRLLASNDPRLSAPATIVVTSPAFEDGTEMPSPYRGASSVSPPLRWTEVPPETVELVLIAEDVDVPFPAPLVHAIAYGIAPGRRSFDAGAIPGLHAPTRASRRFPARTRCGCRPGIPPRHADPGPRRSSVCLPDLRARRAADVRHAAVEAEHRRRDGRPRDRLG